MGIKKINNNKSNKKTYLSPPKWITQESHTVFVVNGLGLVPVGSIPTNNLKKIRKRH